MTKKKVEKIKAAIAEGTKQTEIAKRFKVSRSLVSDIATGRVHKDVQWPSGEPPAPKRAGGQHKDIPDYDPTDKQVLELEAEVVHLTEERNRERQKVKAGAKIAGLFKAITAEMEQRVKPFAALPPALDFRRKAQITEHCVMHLSDGHHDQVVRPEEVGGLEDYNFPICCAAPSATSTRWSNGPRTLWPRSSTFPVLWVLAYGDYTSGEIHKACERSYYRNQFKNCLAIGQLHALMYRDLAAHFEQVNVLYLAGNHGRRTPKKDYLGAHDNWDYLGRRGRPAALPRPGQRPLHHPRCVERQRQYQRRRLQRVATGTTCASNLGIPWYGMVRRQKGLIALGAAAGAQRCRYFCVGHHHAASTLSDVDGELLVNGSLGGHRRFRLQLAVRLPRAGPMDSWRQSEARHHLANERQAAA